MRALSPPIVRFEHRITPYAYDHHMPFNSLLNVTVAGTVQSFLQIIRQSFDSITISYHVSALEALKDSLYDC
jgi:hypothetical protein